MESAPPRFTETTFDHQPGFSAPDDGFDPVLELRRLRHDLMLRLQRLQQSIIAEELQRTDSYATNHDIYGEDAIGIVPSENGTTLYVTPPCQDLHDEPTIMAASEVVGLTAPAPPEFIRIPVVQIEENPVMETVADNPAVIIAVSSEEPAESMFARFLARLNTILIAMGIVGAVAGAYYHLLQKQLAHPQQFALTLLLTGVAMVFIGIVGWWLHRQTRLRFCPG